MILVAQRLAALARLRDARLAAAVKAEEQGCHIMAAEYLRMAERYEQALLAR